MSSRTSTSPPLSTAEAEDEKRRVNHDLSSANTNVDDTEPSTTVVVNPEKQLDGAATPPVAGAVEEDQEYITGMKLVLTMSSITLICFLMLLDTSIVSTVCIPLTLSAKIFLTRFAGCTQNHK
jgi:hypothetical protein